MAQNTGTLSESVTLGYVGRLRRLISEMPVLAWLIAGVDGGWRARRGLPDIRTKKPRRQGDRHRGVSVSDR